MADRELHGHDAANALGHAFSAMLKAKATTMERYNRLTEAEDERLAILEEEMGESIQVIGKIRRHGYESFDPTKTDPPTNRKMLEKELGDVVAAMAILAQGKDIDHDVVMRRVQPKLKKLLRYVHHNIGIIESLVKKGDG